MSIGSNIKTEREKKKLTQKELADRLYVTPQAVSRWENGSVEPSIDTLKQMSAIFGVNLDTLTSNESLAKKEPEVTAPAKPEAKEPTLVGMCGRCGKAIYSNTHYAYCTKSVTYSGRGRHHEHVSWHTGDGKTGNGILCDDCLRQNEEAEKQKQIDQQNALTERDHKAMVWGLWVGGGAGLIMILISIGLFVNKNWAAGGWTLGLSPLAAYGFFAVLYCLIKRNTWAGEIFMNISEFGFVKMPGVIFAFSGDGVVAFFIIKVILGILGFLILIGFLALAFFFTMIFSMFAFPYSYCHPAQAE